MKRRKFGLLIVLVLLFACKKDDKTYCWKCQIVRYRDYHGSTISSEDQIICDKTQNYIYYFEQKNTSSDGQGNGIDMVCTMIK